MQTDTKPTVITYPHVIITTPTGPIDFKIISITTGFAAHLRSIGYDVKRVFV